MKSVVSLLTAALVMIGAPLAYAGGGNNDGRKPYSCNPQRECMARAEGLKGPAAEAAKRDCSRMPKSGTCFGAPGDTPADRGGRTDLDRKKK
jgi:hypothetical protein